MVKQSYTRYSVICTMLIWAFLVAFTLLSAPLYALHIECVGDAYLYTNQGDTIFLTNSDVDLQTKDGSNTDWYNIDGTVYQTNTSSITPDDGGYYIIVNGAKEPFYVFNYAHFKPQNLTLEVETLQCRSTQLRLSGEIPAITYRTLAGQSRTLSRTCNISYTTISWNSSDLMWNDLDTVITSQSFHIGTYTLPAIYKATTISLSYDNWTTNLNLPVDSVVTTVFQPIAVTTAATSTTTTRGVANDPCNEVERPVEESVLSGSAPLDILFRSYPSPAVEFYQWTIYKGSNRIAQRTDDQTRYAFQEPGSYRVVLNVSNGYCPCADTESSDCERDSIEFTVAVSESQLLVPNVFTPNGDGSNDEFRVLYRSLKEFNIWIYNRWGKLVYHSTDPAKGWDGTINGRKASVGAYFYVIRALGTDATTDYSSKIKYKKNKNKNPEAIIGVYQLSGDINLIR